MAAITGADRYNPELIPQLEKAVDAMTAATFSSSTNHTLLRMYQLFPERSNTGIVNKLLLKSLMQLPQPEYSHCLHLLPEVAQSEETFKKIDVMAKALESAKFKQFWEAAAGADELVKGIAGFEDAVRKFVVQTIGITYLTVPKAVVGESVALSGGALDACIKAAGWKVEGDMCQIPPNDSNQHSQARRAENIPFAAVSGLIAGAEHAYVRGRGGVHGQGLTLGGAGARL
eukprot:CAMPEP_0182864970 /NCGR_PEP_ID=MMETSP0034_2-20130328/7444_1 /TAXON_ID=156128 /ORGANISM="Nephroselmis pyriformis, Strain CCMP717" /LENGTH=229 /DNA_ID=CAMNT_0024997247 /DNA_START=40 /DNA_END=726 /DNA_ORIENTATION=+